MGGEGPPTTLSFSILPSNPGCEVGPAHELPKDLAGGGLGFQQRRVDAPPQAVGVRHPLHPVVLLTRVVGGAPLRSQPPDDVDFKIPKFKTAMLSKCTTGIDSDPVWIWVNR